MNLEDLPLLSEFWYDRIVLLQQFNLRYQLKRNAREDWELQLRQWLDDPHYLAFAAELDHAIIGGIVGMIQSNAPGLLPEKLLFVAELMIDLHTPQVNAGVGRVLVQALRDQASQAGIHHLEVMVSAQASVEQAFWRGIGARTNDQLFWMKK